MTFIALQGDSRAEGDASGQVDASVEVEASVGPGWTMTFDDEFDESSVDFSKWQLRQKWGEKVVNQEREAYVTPAQASQAFTFDNGLLHIVARKQQGVYGGVTLPYTSGLLASVPNQKYGYYETRTRMPTGSGLWPAFWLLHTPCYPDIHEIDILEWISPMPNVVLMTDHFGTSYEFNSLQSQVTFSASDLTTAFHVFGLDWEADRIVWYADGTEVGRTMAANALHDVEMYVILNLAVGGDLPGTPAPDAIFPASFDVDYVRVYQRDGTNPNAPPPFGPSLSIPMTSIDAGQQCPVADGGAVDGESASDADLATEAGDGTVNDAGNESDAASADVASHGVASAGGTDAAGGDSGASLAALARGGCSCTTSGAKAGRLLLLSAWAAPAVAFGLLRRRSRRHRRPGR
jgi:beta-glucanase (GH16 family)